MFKNVLKSRLLGLLATHVCFQIKTGKDVRLKSKILMFLANPYESIIPEEEARCFIVIENWYSYA